MKLNTPAVRYGFLILGTSEQAAIALYEGNQPSINDFVANFSNNYNQSGGNTLQIYNTYGIFNEQFPSQNSMRFAKRTGPDITYSKQSIRSGTASWAAIFYQNSSMPTTITDDTKFIIVPVSNLSGPGILKLRSTTVTYSNASSDNLIADFILDISASFTLESNTDN